MKPDAFDLIPLNFKNSGWDSQIFTNEEDFSPIWLSGVSSVLFYFFLLKLIGFAIKLFKVATILLAIKIHKKKPKKIPIPLIINIEQVPEENSTAMSPDTERRGILTVITCVFFGFARTDYTFIGDECKPIFGDRHQANANGGCFILYLGDNCTGETQRIEGNTDVDLKGTFVDAFMSAKLC